MSRCTACPLHEGAGVNASRGYGMMASPHGDRRSILLLLRWPMAYNCPLHRFLLKAMAEIHPKFSANVWVSSVLRCVGPRLSPTMDVHIDLCQDLHFNQLVRRVDPRVIVAVTDEASDWVNRNLVASLDLSRPSSVFLEDSLRLVMATKDLYKVIKGGDTEYTMFLRNLIGVWHASVL